MVVTWGDGEVPIYYPRRLREDQRTMSILSTYPLKSSDAKDEKLTLVPLYEKGGIIAHDSNVEH